MYVVCFYWQGERWRESSEISGTFAHQLKRVGPVSKELAERYITNLFEGVLRFASRGFRFVCFTNENLNLHKDIEIRSIDMPSKKGVLPRMYMFSRDAGLFGHQVLCLDIDVVIVGSLDSLMNYDGRFCARSKFKPGEEYKLDGDVMSFRSDQENERDFWLPVKNQTSEVERITQGRERYWVREVIGDSADRWDKVAPGKVVSYKWHAKGGPPPEASVVSCHGYPRPHQIKEQWIKQYWT